VVGLRGTLRSLNRIQEAVLRIISLLPSATEIVHAVGLGDRLVGVSHECDFPAPVRGLPRVTRSLLPAATATSGAIDAAVRDRVRQRQPLYALDAARLADLRPDLIVTQSICDVCAVAEGEVAAVVRDLPGPPRLLTLEPHRLGDVLDGMQAVADAAGVADAGRAAVAALQRRIDAVAARSAAIAVRPQVMLLEWLDPPFTAGHWSPEIVGIAGGVEVLGRSGERSRGVTWEKIRAADPEVLWWPAAASTSSGRGTSCRRSKSGPAIANWRASARDACTSWTATRSSAAPGRGSLTRSRASPTCCIRPRIPRLPPRASRERGGPRVPHHAP
jgi:iron complex transport system substrate-binding protein